MENVVGKGAIASQKHCLHPLSCSQKQSFFWVMKIKQSKKMSHLSGSMVFWKCSEGSVFAVRIRNFSKNKIIKRSKITITNSELVQSYGIYRRKLNRCSGCRSEL